MRVLTALLLVLASTFGVLPSVGAECATAPAACGCAATADACGGCCNMDEVPASVPHCVDDAPVVCGCGVLPVTPAAARAAEAPPRPCAQDVCGAYAAIGVAAPVQAVVDAHGPSWPACEDVTGREEATAPARLSVWRL